MLQLIELVVWLSVQCSGVIAAPGLVLYSGHCSEAVDFIKLPDGSAVAPFECKAHDESRPGFEHDIAFCLVDESIGRSQLRTSAPTGRLTGYGWGGTIRSGERVRAFVVEFLSFTVHGSFGTHVSSFDFCPGDSGGPIFDSLGQLVGIGSAALVGQPCNAVEFGPRLAYYAPMSPSVVRWIAENSGVDLR